jgi:threonine dehydrogenase-like Zn-dependent dehydrogenase
LQILIGVYPIDRALHEGADLARQGDTPLVMHRGRFEDGPDLYKTFRDKQDGCIKVVLKP